MTKKEKFFKIFSVSINVVLSFLIVLILLFTIFAFSKRSNDGIPQFFGKSYLTVLSDSMNTENEEYNFKGFKRGDIVVIERYKWYEAQTKVFKVGDIITFQWPNPNNPKELLYNTHRIIEVNVSDGYYITQGDVAASKGFSTNPADGYVEKVYFQEVQGLYVSTIPWVGNIVLLFQSTIGFLIFIVLPLLGLFIIELLNFLKAFKSYRREKKGLPEPEKDTSKEDLEKEIAKLKEQLAQKEGNV